MSGLPARVAAGVPSGGQFAASTHPESNVVLAESEAAPPTQPQPVRFDSMEALDAAGYITDEWSRWQQGGCAAYAIALLDANPGLRFGVLGRSNDGDPANGWRETHCFAHDDTFAYDSAGKHPLPYLGIEGDCDVVELESDPDWYGYRDEFDDADYAAALAHADRHAILTSEPVPHGGRATATLPAPDFAARFAPSLWSDSWDHLDELADEDVEEPADEDEWEETGAHFSWGGESGWTVEAIADSLAAGEPMRQPVEVIQAADGTWGVTDGHHRVVAALRVGAPIRYVVIGSGTQ